MLWCHPRDFQSGFRQSGSCQRVSHLLPQIPHYVLNFGIISQEVIIQNFRAKKGTAMSAAPEPPLEELLWTTAMARIILGPSANIQV